MHEIAGLGELRSPWHECQMAWLQNHLNLINAYSQALENLDAAKGRGTRPAKEGTGRCFESVHPM